MYTHKCRVLAALRGEMVDRLPYVPRLDLWYLANSISGTLPKQHAGHADERDRPRRGLGLLSPLLRRPARPGTQPQYLHRGIDVFYSRDTVFDVVLPRTSR